MAQISLYAQKQPIHSYTSNPTLKSLKSKELWAGNPLDKDGRFINREFPFWPEAKELWKWQRETNPQKEQKKNDTFKLKVETDTSFLSHKNNVIVWLGHASFFIRINGVSMITNPVFYNASAVVKRKSALPFDVNLIKGLDYILISHDHRDHLDEKSLNLVYTNNPGVKILSGLNMDDWFNKMLKKPNVETAGWYQQFSTDTSKIEIYFMPARHWSRRGLTDTNKHLWGSFVIKANGKKIFFSGDTGYGSHLKEVGDLFGGIDFCIIGVGAYKPEWFMSSNHISPSNAVKAANEMRTNHFLPMHYGTFDLSDEPMGEPAQILLKEKSESRLNADLHLLSIGFNYQY